MKSEERSGKHEDRGAGAKGVALALVFVSAFTGSYAAVSPSAPSHAQIYQRATNEFAEADFFKPAGPRTNSPEFLLAPLIIQETEVSSQGSAAKGQRVEVRGGAAGDRFGALVVSNGVLTFDPARPTIYYEADTVEINGKSHARFTYVWWHAAREPFDRSSGLDWLGIRLTLNANAQPVIWEVLTGDGSGADLIFVAASLEEAALAEFGKPLPGRRFSIERSLDEAPGAVVPRLLDDSPAPLGPIVYLSAGSHSVSTLICRCMNSQVKKLRAASTYDLRPLEPAVKSLVRSRAEAQWRTDTPFRLDKPRAVDRLERRLRLPRAF